MPFTEHRTPNTEHRHLMRPLKNPQQEVFLLIQRTASELNQELAELLKPAGLTPAKYNALRILRGAGEAGLACRDIADRLVNHDPDVTRLIDWLEARTREPLA